MTHTTRSLTHTARAPYVKALAQIQAQWTDEALSASRASWGGQRIASLALYLHTYANGRCVVCRQHTTMDTLPRVLTSATVAVLVPCAMIGHTSERLGYVAGNVANVCRACVNHANLNESILGELHVWTADTLDAEFVPLTLPKFGKTRPVLTDAEVKAQTESARVWAARGI